MHPVQFKFQSLKTTRMNIRGVRRAFVRLCIFIDTLPFIARTPKGNKTQHDFKPLRNFAYIYFQCCCSILMQQSLQTNSLDVRIMYLCNIYASRAERYSLAETNANAMHTKYPQQQKWIVVLYQRTLLIKKIKRDG